MFDFTWPCRLVSETNEREHWGSRARRAKRQREAALLLTANEIHRRGRPRLPLTVTITRFGKGWLDDDNLATSAKHVRDGVAKALGVDDGDQRITWTYRQETVGSYQVRVLVEERRP
jgi:hypothetical protein